MMETLEVIKRQVSTLGREEQYSLSHYLLNVLTQQQAIKRGRQKAMSEIRAALKHSQQF